METQEMNFDLENSYEEDYSPYNEGEIVEDMSSIDFEELAPEVVEEDESVSSPENTVQENDNESIDIIAELLRQKGIKDPTAIKFEDENGETFEVSFNDLTDEEKLQVLSSSPEVSGNDVDVTQDEQDFLHFLRENNLSLDDFVNLRVQQELENAQGNQVQSTIDSLSNDELYVFDLKQRFASLSDEEVKIALETEKVNESLFNKKMDTLRTAYKEQEDSEKAREEKELEESQLASQREFENLIIDASKEFKEISVIELEQSDVDEALNILFQQDASGTTKFVQALNDPTQLLKMAWFISQGEAAINMLTDYYKKEIASSRKTVKEEKGTTKTQVVIKDTKPTKNSLEGFPDALKNSNYSYEGYGSIHDIDY